MMFNTEVVTEVYVSLPLPDESLQPTSTLFWIQGVAWDAMKADLLASPAAFTMERSTSLPEVYERFNRGIS